MVRVKEDISGWKMSEHGVPDSQLTVLYQTDDYIDRAGHRQARYLCECSCGSGKAIIASPNDIKRGNTKSCGCRTKELNSKRQKKYNTYDLSGEYGIGYCSNTDSRFYFDLQDYDLIKDYCWAEVVYGKSKYHELRAPIDRNTSIRMHMLLRGVTCDHADRNPLNNRRSNLRPATIEENNRNRSLFQNNTSGITGVSFEPSRNSWRARIYFNNKRHELGVFKEKDDAIRARLQAEAKYYKEFAPQRHLFKEYGILEDELL